MSLTSNSILSPGDYNQSEPFHHQVALLVLTDLKYATLMQILWKLELSLLYFPWYYSQQLAQYLHLAGGK